MPVPENQIVRRIAAVAMLAMVIGAATSGCHAKSPVVAKIGVAAPFDGRYREIGYDVIPAVRLAVSDYARQYPNSGLVIEIVAYDDLGNPEKARQQASKLIQDPQVAVVIGHWLDSTTLAALPVYEQARMPLITFTPIDLNSTGKTYNLSPSAGDLHTLSENWKNQHLQSARFMPDQTGDIITDAQTIRTVVSQYPDDPILGGPEFGMRQFLLLVQPRDDQIYFASGAAFPFDRPSSVWSADAFRTFVAGFMGKSLGAAPGLISLSAYEATWLAIRQIAISNNVPLSPGVADGIQFDSNGRRIGAPINIYNWRNDRAVLVQALR